MTRLMYSQGAQASSRAAGLLKTLARPGLQHLKSTKIETKHEEQKDKTNKGMFLVS